MKKTLNENSGHKTELRSTFKAHRAARPMKVVVDAQGCPWICDANADPKRSLADQHCWRCGEMPFTRND